MTETDSAHTRTRAYQNYLKKYSGCEGPICSVKPSPEKVAKPSKSKLASDIDNFLKSEQLEFPEWKKQLMTLETRLARCGKPKVFYSDRKSDKTRRLKV